MLVLSMRLLSPGCRGAAGFCRRAVTPTAAARSQPAPPRRCSARGCRHVCAAPPPAPAGGPSPPLLQRGTGRRLPAGAGWTAVAPGVGQRGRHPPAGRHSPSCGAVAAVGSPLMLDERPSPPRCGSAAGTCRRAVTATAALRSRPSSPGRCSASGRHPVCAALPPMGNRRDTLVSYNLFPDSVLPFVVLHALTALQLSSLAAMEPHHTRLHKKKHVQGSSACSSGASVIARLHLARPQHPLCRRRPPQLRPRQSWPDHLHLRCRSPQSRERPGPRPEAGGPAAAP